MNFFYALTSSLNRFQKTRWFFGWLIYLVVVIQSFIAWISKKEYRTFSDCHFHFRKQAKHPWIHERAIEYPWVQQHLAEVQRCTVLDVGAKNGLPSTDLLLSNGNLVYTIDLNASKEEQNESEVKTYKEDIRSTSFSDGFFDAVIVVSTLEHIGICGRYGVLESDERGDFLAMKEIHRILKPNGIVLVTVPYGTGKSLPLNRLYEAKRIDKLFEDFIISEQQYFRYFEKYSLWFEVSESEAAKNNWDVDPWYSLGCFCLVKPTLENKLKRVKQQ